MPKKDFDFYETPDEDVYKIGYTDKEFKTKYKYALCVK